MVNDERRRPARSGPSVVVLGDLVLDVVLAPDRPLEPGTDVPGRVSLSQGGSAANTAGWLARLGIRTTFVCSVGRDPAGDALISTMRRAGVVVRASRTPNGSGARTGRIGVFVSPGGERSFVADRSAADALAPGDLKPAWFQGADLLHLPAYSLLGSPLGLAGREAVALARAAGALVSLDLASSGPLLAGGREAAHHLVAAVAPDLLFATENELRAFVGLAAADPLEDVLRQSPGLAPIVIVKRGARGALVCADPVRTREAAGPPSAVAGAAPGRRGVAPIAGPRPSLARSGVAPVVVEVGTRALAAADTTGAGDAFDAGFITDWLADGQAGRRAGGRSSRRAGGPARSLPAALRHAAQAGHRTAARQVTRVRPELRFR